MTPCINLYAFLFVRISPNLLEAALPLVSPIWLLLGFARRPGAFSCSFSSPFLTGAAGCFGFQFLFCRWSWFLGFFDEFRLGFKFFVENIQGGRFIAGSWWRSNRRSRL